MFLPLGLGQLHRKVCGNLGDQQFASTQWSVLKINSQCYKKVLTVSDIHPLFWPPVSDFHVLKFVFYIRLPCNVTVIYGDVVFSCIVLAFVDLESVVKETLCYKSTWESRFFWVKCYPATILFLNRLSELKLFIGNDGIAIFEISYWQVFSEKLWVWTRFDVTSMILVEVLKLIVNVDWCLDSGVDS